MILFILRLSWLFLVPNSSLAACNLIVNVFFKYFMRYQNIEVIYNCQSLYLLLHPSFKRLGLFLCPIFGCCLAIFEFLKYLLMDQRLMWLILLSNLRIYFVNRSWHSLIYLSILQLFLTRFWLVFLCLLLILLTLNIWSSSTYHLPFFIYEFKARKPRLVLHNHFSLLFVFLQEIVS